MKKYFAVIASAVLCLIAGTALWTSHVGAATSVILAPIPQFYATDTSGRPLAFGCVFTYQSGTTTPLSSYTDSTGVTLNPNPVILSAAGNANIWIQAGQAYTFRVKSAGGSSCVSGSTRYTINGIGGGASQLSTNVSFSATPQFTAIAQNQLFLFTLTGNAVSLPLVMQNVTAPSFVSFQITENGTGGYTFAWPSNVIGGAPIDTTAGVSSSQTFLWNGTQAIAVGPITTGVGLERTGNQLVSGTLAVTGLLTGNAGATIGGFTRLSFLTFDGVKTVTGLKGTLGGDLAQASSSPWTSLHSLCADAGGFQSVADCGYVALKVVECGGTGTCANTAIAAPRTIVGTRALSGGTATVTGISPAYTNANCSGSDLTATNPVAIYGGTTTSIVLFGTGSDTLYYQCILY